MSSQGHNGTKWRKSPFNRGQPFQSPGVVGTPSTSDVFSPPMSQASSAGHARNQSFSPMGNAPSAAKRDVVRLARSNSLRVSSIASGTFTPQFIKADESDGEKIKGIEGENDFSGKSYVWLKDPEHAFVRGWIVKELDGGRLLVQCDSGTQRQVDADSVDKVNPAKFDKASDMAELTHLNEASVVHNLQSRYQADLIYTYSGLFLVTVNPYCPLPIYTKDYINMYRGASREETKPHIFAMADEAFRNLVEEGENQSILVTGESGAGKTENTKKVIQYLAAVATGESPVTKPGEQLNNLSQQILRANPILEAFGNAQTVRNNNSSRFGKFIRIEFTRSGQIAGAFIDWYLLEKSRVVHVNPNERSYHIFYQLLRGAERGLKDELLLEGMDAKDFDYIKGGNQSIAGVSDLVEWNALLESFHVMGFSEKEQAAILRTIAAVLHLGNIKVMKESLRADQATLTSEGVDAAATVCRLLGISLDPFIEALLHPKVKAGREWVKKVQTPEQVRQSIDALSKGIFERGFGDLVNRINRQLDRTGVTVDDSHFIGVLDIAGFEIFEENSFEQLCINFTNEKLQQFFNHHMFVLEQEEYAREQIEWKFIDFGRDLQPTIDLIELPNPIGIFSCLDEDSVMPKATDRSFTEKLHSLWDRKTPKYRRSLLSQGFILTHYAAEVEYTTEGWLEKNKDPLNDNVTRLLASSTDKHVAHLFVDHADSDEGSGYSTRSRVKKGLFRTVAQRHKEQLSTLMSQLHSTHPHFVRCILPNHKKRPKLFSAPLVLDQLRCNGVLEGIRIARTGFPNRLPFSEFRARYEVLCFNVPKGHLDGQVAAKIMLEKLNLDKAFYRVGLTKVFFRAGVLAELEEQRDSLIRQIMSRFQSVARGFTQRRIANKRLYRAEATRIIQKDFRVYLDMQANPWWRLFVRMRPLLGATRYSSEVKKRDEMIQKLEHKAHREAHDRQKLEEERRRAEAEIHRVQHTLESERALALDKDEIFKRLQSREAELEEKLQGAIDDQEHLEEQLDKVVQAKRLAEAQLEDHRLRLEQAGTFVAKLEEEKKELVDQISKIEDNVAELERSRNQGSQAEESLGQEVKMLTSHLALKERKLGELEAKLLKNDQELDLKLASASKDLSASKKRINDLMDENRQIRQQMSELSSTSTGYEDLIRQKDSELSVLKSELRRFEDDRRIFDEEKRSLFTKHDSLQSRFQQARAEIEAMKSQRTHLEREVADARKLLEEKVSEGAELKMLQRQTEDLKEELYQVRKDLSRERQSRDDVQMLGDHKYTTLKRDYDAMNEAKITIEKEMYIQQDYIRRNNEARATAERERKEYQNELRELRQKYLELQEAKLDVQAEVERNVSQQFSERYNAVRRELDERQYQLKEIATERDHYKDEAQGLTRMIADSDIFRLQHDQHKERLERELVTIKGRLTASENDNRALLNKVQQKNLEVARSNSRAGDSQRNLVTHLQSEKFKAEEENKKTLRQLEESRLTISALEKQKEKLTLHIEDLQHEINREHMTSRNAEKSSSTLQLQLAEANRQLESERRLRTQAQSNTRTMQSSLDSVNHELGECHKQLILLQKVFDPTASDQPSNFEAVRLDIAKSVDLAQKIDNLQQQLRVAIERHHRAEAQLVDTRDKHEDELAGLETRHSSSKRALLEEMTQSQVNTRRSPMPFSREQSAENARPWSPREKFSTPTHNRQLSNATNGSARSDKTVDTVTYNNRMDLAAELEMVQNQLQMSEMRCRHLQSQARRSPERSVSNGWDESPSIRRTQKLERENNRLHEQLDDSAKKVAALENSIRTGQLSLQEVQTKSHAELYALINSQEQSRRSLQQVHSNAVAELSDAKTAFEELKHNRAASEVEVRDLRSELEDLKTERDQDAVCRNQLLQEFSDLQIRLDAETSQLQDITASLNLYKARSDEYFSKLEQAEIAVLKASRAEQFAKTQAREAEDTCATIMSERKAMDRMVEDLQRQTQQYEERIEDLSADLDGALQAKKRMQNELEDYRSQRAMDIEDKQSSMEQTRKKYQSELGSLTGELELERDNLIAVRSENGRLRDELEELRSKWDDEVLNSSTWAKEKSRLELTLQDLSSSRDEAVNAHNEAQSKIVALLSQVRNLRTDIDDVVAERDMLMKERKGLEARLSEAGDRLDDLARGESPSMRNAAGMDRELLELKSALAQQEDIAAAAVGKMRRAEALAQEIQRDIGNERESNVNLHKEKAALEKSVKDLQLKLVDLETRGYSSASGDVRFLHGRIQELEKALEHAEITRASESRSVRNVDRTVKDLQSQIERRDKANTQLQDDISKSRDKIERLLTTIDELQQSDSANHLSAKRAERLLQEEREKGLRLERELEGWKGLRMERSTSLRRRSGMYNGGAASETDSRRGSQYYLDRAAGGERLASPSINGDVPSRKVSGSKGFL